MLSSWFSRKLGCLLQNYDQNLEIRGLASGVLDARSFPAWADLTGTQVTGSLQFSAPPPVGINYFDPANQYVDGPLGTFPGGSLNSSGTTVTISGTAVEFGYKDSDNTDSANFTGSQLTINAAAH